MNIPQLPNDIIMNIIKMADGGLNAHKKKMIPVFKQLDAKIAFLELVRYFKDLCYNEKWDEVSNFRRTVIEMGYDPQVFLDKL